MRLLVIIQGLAIFVRTFYKECKKLWHYGRTPECYTSSFHYEELNKIVWHAWNCIPFYKHYWSKNNFNPLDFRSLQDYHKIPIINKNTIMNYAKDMIPIDYNRSLLSLVMSGGTTGMPMNFYLNQWQARAKELSFQLWGNKYYFGHKLLLDKVAIFRGHRVKDSLIKKKIFWERSYKDHGLYFSSFHITDENYDIYLKKLRAFKPKFIKAYPSSIVALCILMKKHGDHGFPNLKGVICSSENVYEWQRVLINQTLGVEIYSYYGHSEKCVCAFQGSGNSMYFNPLYGYTEFLNDENQPINTSGLMAKVVVTGYNHDYFPLIRYDTFDYVVTGENIKGVNKVADRIVGRAQEFVYDKSNNRIPFTCSDEVMWCVDGILAYQYQQDIEGLLTLKIVIDNSFNFRSFDLIKTKARKIFVNFDFKVQVVDFIPKTKNGKFRYLIQNIGIEL